MVAHPAIISPRRSTTSTSSTPPHKNRFKIKAPTTTNDNGEPSDQCFFDAKRVLRLIEDERYLSAQELYSSILDRLQESENANADNNNNNNNNSSSSNDSNNNNNNNSRRRSSSSKKNRRRPSRSLLKRQKSTKKVKVKNENHVLARELLDDNEDILDKMEDRCRLFVKAKKNLDVNDDWTLAQTMFGVTTYYRKESDGSLSIKLDGTVEDASLFDQIAVLREIDLNSLWAPFVTSSMTVAHLDKLDTVGWFVVGLPHFGIMRDACFRAIGCDSMYEDGSVMLVAEGIADRPEDLDGDDKWDLNRVVSKSGSMTSSIGSVVGFDAAEETRIEDSLRTDPILDTLDLPPPPTRTGSGRMTIRSVSAQIHIESATSTTTKIVANIDPNLPFIPQPLLDFIMKRVFGLILYKMQGAARKISRDPITNLHAIKIREDDDFYRRFLLPKFRGICKIRGWPMPPISAFELSDAQLEMADVFINKQKFKLELKAIKLFNAHNSDNNLDEYLESSHSVSGSEPADTGNSTTGKDGPKVRAIPRDSDDMSDISKYSTSSSFLRTLRGNPISSYLRELEEKTQLRKAREIVESRERAAARLKPKSLNEDAKSRLKELRKARDRHKSKAHTHIDEDPASTPRTPNTQQEEEENELDRRRKWKISLSSHGLFTKIFVLQFLMVSLFCLLYLDTAFEKFVAFREGSFWMERVRGLVTIAYIGFAGWVHFILCYVALMYAFSALQLGSIAGKRTRAFYSRYVHWMVATVSAGMVGFGIIKPGLVKLLQRIVWNAYSISRVVETSLLPIIPDKVTATFQMTISAICSVISSTRILFLESNILGRFFVYITNLVFGVALRSFRYPFVTFADIAIERYEGAVETIPWHEDAFFTARALLSHSAFFLLVLLLLFNLSANQARKAVYLDDDVSEEDSSSNPASTSSDIQNGPTSTSTEVSS